MKTSEKRVDRSVDNADDPALGFIVLALLAPFSCAGVASLVGFLAVWLDGGF